MELPVADAFELFTPLGEKRWAPGWEPEFHHPADGAAVGGAVFVTRGHGELTIWVLVDWRPGSFSVRYARVTPGLRAGTVEVRCREESAASTRVEVTYDLVALGAAGEADLATWTEEWYADYLADWEREIAAALAS